MLLKAKRMTLSNTANKKTFCFEIIKYIFDEKQLLEVATKNSFSVPVLKSLENEMPTNRKMFILKDFWSQVQNI